jgi:hypothetical protein
LDVASRIRAQLAEGKWPEEIVAGLVAEGMSEANARRIVDRITDEGVLPASPAVAPSAHTAKPFPIEAVVILAVILAIAAYWVYEWRRPLTAEESAAAQKVEERKVADQQRIAELAKGGDLEAQAKALVEGAMATAEKASDARAADELLQNPDGFMRCEGARLYEESKIPDQSGLLARLLQTDPDLSVRRCVLNAMLASGRDAATVLGILERLESQATLREIVAQGYTRLSADPNDDVRTRAIAGLTRMNR